MIAMNAAHILSGQPWVERLGWTLVHFLWQGVLIAVLYLAVRKSLGRASSPGARYLLACAALATMVAAPLVTFGLLGPSELIQFNPRLAGVPTAAGAVGSALMAPVSWNAGSDARESVLTWVVMFWLAGAIAFWVRLMGGCVAAVRMRSTQVRPASPEWQQTLCKLCDRIGLSRPVRLLVSARVQAPTVVGWLRPVVLAPVGALTGLAPEQVEALLVHELTHIRRHDYLVNILQSVAEALLFYHPAVWWVSGQIRTERELCCDDVAVSVTGDVLGYARALAELEASRPAHFHVAVAANGGSLADRIGRLLGESRHVPQTRPGPGVIVSAILLAVTAYAVFGQSTERPAFQVASIKRNTATTPRGMLVRPQAGGRLTTENAPILMLIQNAYSVQAFQVVGGPGWVNSDGYDMEAKPEGNIDRKQMWLMVQTLLADRFKLALHRETRELPAYVLTVTRAGLKQAPPKEGGCVTPEPDAPPPLPRPGMARPCGKVMIDMSSLGLRMSGSKISIGEFIRTLAMIMDRPVIDKTGIATEFEVSLDFTPDQSTAGLPGSGGPRDPGGPRLPTDTNRPSIFAALQEQLGLKLDSGKGPVEVLVIDHVERPSGN
jgi:uncharacterized protein (TIGR03435 family)